MKDAEKVCSHPYHDHLKPMAGCDQDNAICDKCGESWALDDMEIYHGKTLCPSCFFLRVTK